MTRLTLIHSALDIGGISNLYGKTLLLLKIYKLARCIPNTQNHNLEVW